MNSTAIQKIQILNMSSADYIPDHKTGREGEVSA